jgi:hypothetical protein
MRTAAKYRPNLSNCALTLLLLGAHTLFLWMFFCGESVEQTATHGLMRGYADEDLPRTAEIFAARWRHGMAGNSFLYMPGFYAVGVITWMWSIRRSIIRMLLEASILMTAATALGAWFAPWGAPAAIHGFENATGASVVAIAGGFTPASAAEAIYTLITWSVGMVCGRIAVSCRSLKPLILPIVLNIILLMVRPWAVNGYTSQWIRDILLGLPEAILSVMVAPVLLALLIGFQMRCERDIPAFSHN